MNWKFDFNFKCATVLVLPIGHWQQNNKAIGKQLITNNMILRFEVNQAEAFRQGVDVQKSTNHLNIDPSEIAQAERDLIADRLNGIDVCKLSVSWDGTVNKAAAANDDCSHHRIVANLPTYEALLTAIKENQKEVDAELKRIASKSGSPA